jgi:hypothetical protein
MDRKKLAKRIARRFAYRKDKEERRQKRIARHQNRTKTAGEVRFVTDRGPDEFERQIPSSWEYDVEHLPKLSRILWGLSHAHGHLVSVSEKFHKLKGSNISPDGKLGGQGYVQNIKEMKQDISECVAIVSNFVDTLDDEVRAEHWQEDQGELSEEERAEIDEKLDEAEEIAADPQEFADEEYEEEVEEDVEEGLSEEE